MKFNPRNTNKCNELGIIDILKQEKEKIRTRLNIGNKNKHAGKEEDEKEYVNNKNKKDISI